MATTKRNRSIRANTTDAETRLTLRDVLREYAETDGELADLSNSGEQIRQARSAHLMMVARQYPTEKAFEAACKAAEEWILSDKAGKAKLSKLPRSWINAKSNIKAGIRRGMKLDDYPTESALRSKLTEIRKAEKSGEAVTVPQSVSKAASDLMGEIHRILMNDPAGGEAKAIAVLEHAKDEADKILAAVMPVEPTKPTKKKAATKKAA